MRVAWVVYGTIEQATGGYVYDRKVIEGLRAAGDEVEIVSIAPARSAIAGGLALARRLRGDVVVGDELCFRELGPAFAVRRGMARVLLVHHLTSWEQEGWRARRTAVRERLAMALSDAIVTTSDATAERLRAEHGVSAEVALPGADRLPRRARVASDGIELLFVGSWIARKRLRDLAAAFARIGDVRARLVIAGDAEREPAYAAEVRAALRDVPVHVRGVLDEAGLADAFARADALVLPSSLEGYGMVLTEALHAGVPVIASRAIAAPARLDETRDALLFDDGGLEAALRRFLGDTALRARMQREAGARATTPGALPTWASTSRGVRAALLRAVSRRSGSGVFVLR